VKALSLAGIIEKTVTSMESGLTSRTMDRRLGPSM